MKGTANPSLVIHPVVDCRFVPRPANLGNKSRCDMLKWLVFTPRSGAENDADAAIFVLRARAARNRNGCHGLAAAIRTFAAFVDLTSH